MRVVSLDSLEKAFAPKLQAVDLSPRSIKRLKIASAVYIAAAPIMASCLPLVDWMFGLEDGANNPPAFMFLLLALALTVTFILFITSLFYLTSHRIWGRMEVGAKDMDEWEVSAKDKAYSFSYKVVQSTLIPILGLAFFARFIDVMGFHSLDNWASFFGPNFFISLTFACVLISFYLPVTYFAWTTKPLDVD